MKDLKQIYDYGRYSSEDLKRHKQELQDQINAINGELNLRRADLIESLKNQLYDIFEKAKEYGIAIEISSSETYLMYNPTLEDEINDITLS